MEYRAKRITAFLFSLVLFAVLSACASDENRLSTASSAGTPSAASVSEAEETDPPRLLLDENEVLLLDGEAFFGISGTAVYDADFRELDYIPDAIREHAPLAETADCQRPLILLDRNTLHYGLYSIAEKDWIEAPSYVRIEENENGFLLTSYGGNDMPFAPTYFFAGDDGMILESGRPEEMEARFYRGARRPAETSEEFLRNFPYIPESCGAEAEDVSFWYASYDGTGHFIDTKVLIQTDKRAYVYTRDGTFLMRFDPMQFAAESTPSRKEEMKEALRWCLNPPKTFGSDSVWLLNSAAEPAVCHIYEGGREIHRIQPADGASILCAGTDFYLTEEDGLYVFYKYDGTRLHAFPAGGTYMDN